MTSTEMKSAMSRCLSCNRWSGERGLTPDRAAIEHAADARGLCTGGPWNGTWREPRNACGRWVVWEAIRTTHA